MSKAFLPLNAGSSSTFSVFALPADGGELALVCRGLQENIGEDDPHFKAFDRAGRVLIDVHHAAVRQHRKQAPTHRRRSSDAEPASAGDEVYDHQASYATCWLGSKRRPTCPMIAAATEWCMAARSIATRNG
ncbi:MAG: hypothetical protein U1F59_04120 [Candidatus Competibacteraceae bacterium]